MLTDSTNTRGQVTLERPRPDVLVIRIVGHLSLEDARRIAETRARMWTDVSKHVEFFDCETMSSYDSAARRLLTTHSFINRSRIERMHVFTRSLLVRMGVRAAMVTLGSLVLVHPTRHAFDAMRLGSAADEPVTALDD